jgi:hypothetical protein
METVKNFQSCVTLETEQVAELASATKQETRVVSRFEDAPLSIKFW